MPVGILKLAIMNLKTGYENKLTKQEENWQRFCNRLLCGRIKKNHKYFLRRQMLKKILEEPPKKI